MLDVTPQERTALIVLAVLLTGGALARHQAWRTEVASGLQYSSERADTLNPGSGLRDRVVAEIERERVRDMPLQPGERIDPNRASADELARLPRIGPAVAERIVAHRDSAGPFRAADDLLAVTGVGPTLLEGIRPHLTLPAARGGGTRNPEMGNQIDVNRASAEELESLPGIGPAIASRIVEYRDEHGPFRRFEDLENVSGIGPRLRERVEAAARLRP